MTINNTTKTDVNSFARLLRAEWTKFWTARRWVTGMAAAALVIILLGVLYASVFQISCEDPNSNVCPLAPVGPGGEAVRDRFYFVHQPLNGDGSITVHVTSLTGIITYPPPNHDKIVPGVVPWAKAGIIIKDGIQQGSVYAAIMVTGSHGVRMQYNYTQDTASSLGSISAELPRWLRLTRSGDTLTGYDSIDGVQWTLVGTDHQTGLPDTVQVGLFVTSPCDLTVAQMTCRFTNATAVFDHIVLQGDASSGMWNHDDIGAVSGLPAYLYGNAEESGGTFTVTGSGDIAPLDANSGQIIERTLIGTFAGLIAVMIVAVLFATSEYRKEQVGAIMLSRPGSRHVLAAKAIVIAIVTFITGLSAAFVVVPLGVQILKANGNQILPVTLLTELRIQIGTALLLAVAAVFALALGALFRHSVPAIITAIAVFVLPFILAVATVLPVGVSQWLLRLTPAAGFAIQQSIPEYPQVLSLSSPLLGYYPLAPWAGFAVLCGYTVIALGMAILRLRRRDA
jgi:ABC-type transport system involved in multi-copper enzyme maturation permease subunit